MLIPNSLPVFSCMLRVTRLKFLIPYSVHQFISSYSLSPYYRTPCGKNRTVFCKRSIIQHMVNKLRSLKTRLKSVRDKVPNPLPSVESKAFEFIAREGFIKFLKKHNMLFFADQNPKEKVPTFQEILNNINYSVLKLPNQPWEINYSYKNSQGVTKVNLHNKFNKKRRECYPRGSL